MCYIIIYIYFNEFLYINSCSCMYGLTIVYIVDKICTIRCFQTWLHVKNISNLDAYFFKWVAQPSHSVDFLRVPKNIKTCRLAKGQVQPNSPIVAFKRGRLLENFQKHELGELCKWLRVGKPLFPNWNWKLGYQYTLVYKEVPLPNLGLSYPIPLLSHILGVAPSTFQMMYIYIYIYILLIQRVSGLLLHLHQQIFSAGWGFVCINATFHWNSKEQSFSEIWSWHQGTPIPDKT